MADKERERGVYRTFTNPLVLRLTDEQLKSVQKAAKIRSKTVSEFLRDAAMVSVNAVVEEDLARKQAEKEESERTFVPRNPRPSRGLGLSPKREEPSAPPVEQPTTAVLQPTIVIQSPASSTSSRDEVDLLVDYLLAARNTIDFEERKRLANKVIVSSTSSKEEQARLAKSLEDRVKTRIAQKKSEQQEPKRSGWGFLGGFGGNR